MAAIRLAPPRPAGGGIACMLMALAAPTTAADAGTAGSDGAAAADGDRIETLSVTATRNPLPAFEFPGMVSVVTEEQIRLRQPSTADDILKWVPNVEFTGGPRRTGMEPSIRGFSGPDVIVTVDGVRQNFVSGHDGRFFADPSLLREAEVLRGGASTLYGSGGTGGVIALRTVRAEDLLADGQRAGLDVSTGFRSVNEERFVTGTAYGRVSERLNMLGSITRRATGEIELGDGSTLDRTDDDILAGLAKIDWQPGPGQRLAFAYQRFDNEAEEPNNGQGVGDDNLVDKDSINDNARLRWTLAPSGQSVIDLDTTLYYNRAQLEEVRLDDNGAGPAGELLEREVETFGLRAENTSRIRRLDDFELALTYGVEAWRDEQNVDGLNAVPNASSTFTGGFVQAELRLRKPLGLPGEWLVIPGVRLDRYSSDSDDDSAAFDDNDASEVSPSFALSYSPLPWLRAFASYDEAFRAPGVGELFQRGVHFRIPIGPGIVNRFVPNSGLDPQRAETVEYGLGLTFSDLLQPGDRLQMKASRFVTDGEDFIDTEVEQPAPFVDCNPFIPGACDGITRAVNVPRAELDGSELEATYESRRARVALGFSNVDGENERTGEALGVLTPAQLTLDAALKFPERNLLTGWRMIAADDFDDVDDPSEEREGYDVHDFYVAWTPGSGPFAGVRVDLAVENAFDEAYSRVFTGAVQPGRNASLRLGYSFGR